MALSTRPCAFRQCRQPCRALCLFCTQYLCREHFDNHDHSINAQIPTLVKQIKTLINQLDDSLNPISSSLKCLNQWRINAHRTVDRFYEEKYRQYQQIIERKTDEQKRQFDKMEIKLSELIRQQQATDEEINSMQQLIENMKFNIRNMKNLRLNINPLLIADNLVTIPNENYGIVDPNNHFVFENCEKFYTLDKSLSRWKVEKQAKEIPNSMSMFILQTIRQFIDTHGSSNMEIIMKKTKDLLNISYGEHWIVQIVDERENQYSEIDDFVECLRAKETQLKWIIRILKRNF
ncbi:unnamed protein product [Adineta ricciae]|uniref:Uncharacterized protein n=1 Tax=Adineta ricciae TaxID=249248 RepID=A0A814I1Q6_ADIRI|nr:unnamed protein product [Adineta ricciae]CAF1406771.1 unnamed protein product [Adineta ricciae]